ncbi:MAG: hypothetical protein R3F20_11300 [Planctomycetota bacterium]
MLANQTDQGGEGERTRGGSRRLRGLFAICDELDRSAEHFDDEGGGPSAGRLRARRARLRRDFLRLAAGPIPAPLARAARGEETLELDPEERLLAMLLLNRRIRDGEVGISGRDLLWIAHDNAFDVLAALPRLEPGGTLFRRGLIQSWVGDAGPEADGLDRYVSFSAEAWERLTGAEGEPTEEEIFPFVDDADFFLAVRDLVVAHQRRAARLFAEGVWREIHGEPEETPTELEEEIERIRGEIAARFELTPEGGDLALVAFKRDLALGGPELLVVAALLVQEALVGDPALPALDLVRLVSGSERELLRKRALLSSRNPLLAGGTLELEDGPAAKCLTGTAWLADWVVERLLDARFPDAGRIASDEKIEFHRYLSRLDDSEDFYRKLD